MSLQPVADRILVKPDTPDSKTPGGIVLPDAAKEIPTKGTVIAIGPGKMLENGELVACSVKVGDQILFSKYEGIEVEIEGETHKVIRDDNVVAVFG